MKKTLIAFLISGLTWQAYADVGSDLDTFFKGMGYASNTTSPAAFESQAAGFFGGGSLYARNQVRQYQLVQLDLPSYRAGCGGIDLYTGSMSFLSAKEFVDLGKSVMTNAGAYAVDVMLASTVPELKQVRDYLQQLEQMAIHASVNSCELAQNFVGGVFPKTTASQQKICKDQGTMGSSGLFTDYTTARMRCAGSGFDEALEKASQDETMKKQVVINKNIVWSILQENAFLSTNTELAEMVMSLTGTLIIDKNGKVTNIPSLAGNADLINALVGYGKGSHSAKIWRCSDGSAAGACMQVKLDNLVIPEKSSLTYKVRDLIQKINNALKADSAPSAEIKSFLSLVSLPVMKFLSVLNSSPYAAAAVDIEEYAELIAHDLLSNYLSQLLAEVETATAGSELNEDLVKGIQRRIDKARSKVAELNPKVGNKLKEKLVLIERMGRIEKQVAETMGSVIN